MQVSGGFSAAHGSLCFPSPWKLLTLFSSWGFSTRKQANSPPEGTCYCSLHGDSSSDLSEKTCMQRKIPTLRPADRFIIASRLFTVAASPYINRNSISCLWASSHSLCYFCLCMASFDAQKSTAPARLKVGKNDASDASSGARTLDTLIKSQVLFQLS